MAWQGGRGVDHQVEEINWKPQRCPIWPFSLTFSFTFLFPHLSWSEQSRPFSFKISSALNKSANFWLYAMCNPCFWWPAFTLIRCACQNENNLKRFGRNRIVTLSIWIKTRLSISGVLARTKTTSNALDASKLQSSVALVAEQHAGVLKCLYSDFEESNRFGELSQLESPWGKSSKIKTYVLRSGWS